MGMLLAVILGVMNSTSPASASPGSSGVPSLHQAAAAIRFNLNWQWTAIKMQYERLSNSILSPDDLVDVAMRKHMSGIVDMDFLVIAVRRLLRVAEQAKRSGCDANGTLKPVIKDFESHWGHIIDARNSLEHVDDPRPERVLLPMSSSNGDWQFHMPGNSINMQELFNAAETITKTINKVIEPYESQQANPQV